MDVATVQNPAEQLFQALYQPNPQNRIAALKQIAALPEWEAVEYGALERTADLFQDPDFAVQCVALDTMGAMGASANGYADYIASMLGSSDKEVREKALLNLGYTGSSQHLQKVEQFVNDQDLDLVINAVKSLGELLKGCDSSTAASLLPTLKEKLKSADPDVAAAAAGALAGLPDTPADEVKTMLTHKAAKVKVAALENLQTPDKLVGAIAACVGDSDSQVRVAAVKQISYLGEKAESETAAIGKLLSHSEIGVKTAAAGALAGIGAKAASQADALVPLLTDSSEDKSMLLLSKAGVQPKAEATYRKPACAAAWALSQLQASSKAADVAKGLESADYEVRIECLKALATMGAEGAKFEEEAMKCVEDPVPMVTANACLTLGAMAESSAPSSASAEKVADCLKDKLPMVRAAALQGLAKMGDEATNYLEEIVKKLTDPIWSVKTAACAAIAGCGEMGQMYAADICRLIYDNDPQVRNAAVTTLAQMGERGAAFADEIAYLLEDPYQDPTVRQSAELTLEQMGMPAGGAMQSLTYG